MLEQRRLTSSRKKQLVLALAKAHLGETSDHTFDDFVVGKGRGLIILLHGPPGVDKTLTAEGLSEHLKRPLYAVSAGEVRTAESRHKKAGRPGLAFLKKAVTANGAAKYNPEDLDGLARKDLNGRQIKNMVAAAHALAVYQNSKVSMSHLELVTNLSEEFESDISGAGQASNKNSCL